MIRGQIGHFSRCPSEWATIAIWCLSIVGPNLYRFRFDFLALVSVSDSKRANWLTFSNTLIGDHDEGSHWIRFWRNDWWCVGSLLDKGQRSVTGLDFVLLAHFQVCKNAFGCFGEAI